MHTRESISHFHPMYVTHLYAQLSFFYFDASMSICPFEDFYLLFQTLTFRFASAFLLISRKSEKKFVIFRFILKWQNYIKVIRL